MKARITASIVGVSALGILAGPAITRLAAQTCTPAQGRTVWKIMVTLTPKSNGTGCVVADVDPKNVVMVTPGDVIDWTFKNQCSTDKRMKIGSRRPKRPDVGNPNWPKDEDFVSNHQGKHIKASPNPIPAKGTGTVCAVVRTASPRLYKYDIKGDASEDPEVEVQPPPPPPEPK